MPTSSPSSENTPKNILLTGGTGFIGQYIVAELLQHGYAVRVLARHIPPAKKRFPAAEYVQGDVLDIFALEDALQGIDTVIHAAAHVSFWRKERAKMMRINVEGTANVVNLCLDAGITRLIHLSSTAAIGHADTPEEPISEQTRWTKEGATSAYSTSKYLAEMHIHRGLAEGIEWAAMLNPGVVMGAPYFGDAWGSGTPKMFQIVQKGLRFYNRGTIGAVGVADVAKAVRLLLQQQATVAAGSRYLMIADAPTQQDFFGQIARELQQTPPAIGLPPLLSLAAGRVSEALSSLTGKPPIISLETMRSSIATHRYNATRICRDLNFTYTPLPTVIAEAAAKFRETAHTPQG